MKDSNPYTISTGWIFGDLTENWEKYDRNFLISLEDDFKRVLLNAGIISVIADETNQDYLRNYELVRYPVDLERAKSPEMFPFPEYFLHPSDFAYPHITSYNEQLTLEPDHHAFNLFFALKLSLTDVMKLDEFLQYHLENSFENDTVRFHRYLELLVSKYQSILEPLAEQVRQFMQRPPEENKVEENLYDVKWTGDKNKTQFVQLIYGMHRAKLLNNGEGEITKIVGALATLFKVELNESTWQRNLSDSIHKTNSDYSPEIFDSIKKGYQDYVSELIEKKKKQ